MSFEKYFTEPFQRPLRHVTLASHGCKLENNTSEEIIMGFNEFIFVNRESYSSLYKKIFNEDKQKLLSIIQSDLYEANIYMKPWHWTYKSLGSYSKLFISHYINNLYIFSA